METTKATNRKEETESGQIPYVCTQAINPKVIGPVENPTALGHWDEAHISWWYRSLLQCLLCHGS